MQQIKYYDVFALEPDESGNLEPVVYGYMLTRGKAEQLHRNLYRKLKYRTKDVTTVMMTEHGTVDLQGARANKAVRAGDHLTRRSGRVNMLTNKELEAQGFKVPKVRPYTEKIEVPAYEHLDILGNI